jgi:hypothetical protein
MVSTLASLAPIFVGIGAMHLESRAVGTNKKKHELCEYIKNAPDFT